MAAGRYDLEIAKALDPPIIYGRVSQVVKIEILNPCLLTGHGETSLHCLHRFALASKHWHPRG